MDRRAQPGGGTGRAVALHQRGDGFWRHRLMASLGTCFAEAHVGHCMCACVHACMLRAWGALCPRASWPALARCETQVDELSIWLAQDLSGAPCRAPHLHFTSGPLALPTTACVLRGRGVGGWEAGMPGRGVPHAFLGRRRTSPLHGMVPLYAGGGAELCGYLFREVPHTCARWRGAWRSGWRGRACHAWAIRVHGTAL